jgi:hypothetical protein
MPRGAYLVINPTGNLQADSAGEYRGEGECGLRLGSRIRIRKRNRSKRKRKISTRKEVQNFKAGAG